MANPASNIATINSDTPATSADITEKIKQRRSNELVIGLCGAIGSGVKSLKGTLESQLNQQGYVVEHIRLSELIAKNSDDPEATQNLIGYNRYTKLQDLGDKLRENYRNSIMAELAVKEISISREIQFGKDRVDDGTALKNTKKAAYIINQIKHPDEIELLHQVYRNNFYLLGLLRTEEERKQNLKDELIPDEQIASLIERDRKSTDKHGQQVEKCLHKSDYFIKNIDDEDQIVASVNRFIQLIHGSARITPKIDEVGMYTAFSSSLKSACLSRQVGAAITDDEGTILATGCNDVPKFGGGLYNADSLSDKRCFNNGKQCHNDKHKRLLQQEITKILSKKGITEAPLLASEIIENSKAKSLIEYSRAIHAEMDAITSLARNSSYNTLHKTLFCTTYPCHVCARHIVSAGIKRVVYIEPYEKSLALQLHGDSICHANSNAETPSKVVFENFEGVSPKRYAKFFGYNQKRKDDRNGEAIDYTVVDSSHVDPQYLDSYVEYETKVVDEIPEELNEEA